MASSPVTGIRGINVAALIEEGKRDLLHRRVVYTLVLLFLACFWYGVARLVLRWVTA